MTAVVVLTVCSATAGADSASSCLHMSIFRNCLGTKSHSVAPIAIRVNSTDAAFKELFHLEKAVATAAFIVCPSASGTYSFSCEVLVDDGEEKNHEVY